MKKFFENQDLSVNKIDRMPNNISFAILFNQNWIQIPRCFKIASFSKNQTALDRTEIIIKEIHITGQNKL